MNTTEKIQLKVRPGAELILEDCDLLGNAPGEVVFDLRRVLKEMYQNFGQKFFDLSYTTRGQTVLRASSAIGVSSGWLSNLEVLPKIPGLHLGKCLGLAQYCSNMGVAFENRNKISALVSNEAEYSAVEYLAYSLFDALISIERNGFARVMADVLIIDTKVQGSIDFQSYFSNPSFPSLPQQTIEPNLDIFPNQVIKAAAQVCIKNIREENLKQGFIKLLEHLRGVEDLGPRELPEVTFIHSFSMPREDYKKALLLSCSILNGGSFEGFGDTLTPSFMLNLDKLFEDFCGTAIHNMMKPEFYSVKIQQDYAHDSVPNLSPKKIIPDILISSNKKETSIVIDAKNKYSSLRENGEIDMSNPDIFQLSYYMRTLGLSVGILLYPVIKPKIQFPVKGSESKSSYLSKVKKFFASEHNGKIELFPNSEAPLVIYQYGIDLGGSMQNSLKSIASASLLIEQLLGVKNEA